MHETITQIFVMLLGPSVSTRLILRSPSHCASLRQKLFSTRAAKLANKIPSITNNRQADLLFGTFETNRPISPRATQKHKAEIPVLKAPRIVAATEDRSSIANSTGEEAAPGDHPDLQITYHYAQKRDPPSSRRARLRMARVKNPVLFICDMQEKFRAAIWEFAKVYVTFLFFFACLLWLSHRLFEDLGSLFTS